MDPDSDIEIECTYDDVLKKIGRNLLLFQQAEQQLRSLSILQPRRPTEKDAVELREALVLVVEERSHLVHESLSELVPDTLENYRNLALNLDRQREKILPAIKRLLGGGMTIRNI